MLEDVRDPGQVALVAHEILESLALPFTVPGHEITATGTIGISLSGPDGDDAPTLLQRAETAMRQAKVVGRGTFGFFDVALARNVGAMLDLGRDLRGAAARGELVVYYQPQVDLANGSLIGAEALVRWQHPTRGLIMPGSFIPLAEDLGIIGEIGAWVLSAACSQVATWDARGFHLPSIAVNLSAQQLDRADLVSEVQAALDAAVVRPDRLELEVTESMVMRDPERALDALAGIQRLGVGLAIDDFGTGYSSLAQFGRMVPDTLKIDISFVRKIGLDPASEAIIRVVLALAGIVGCKTVAEGIERPEQAEFLRRAGCAIAQGYLYGRPVPADEFIRGWQGRSGDA